MSKKLSISKKLTKRKYAPAPRLISWLYKLIMVDIVGRKYKPNFHIIDDVNDCDGPCFVIFNHLSRIDHMYVCGATYPRITNMIAGHSEFYRKKFSLIFKLNRVIPKKNYSPDKLTISATSKVIKKGGCVTFAPEGLASDYGANKPIVPGTSKMFKHFKVPVYLCYLEGQYLQNTKVCLDERYGETHATMSLLFTKEDVEIAIKSELSNGVDKVITATGFTFNEQGLTVSKSDSEISTQITEDGMTVSKSGDVVLTANNEGVSAQNLHATTYLIIGNYSRFEDYINTAGEARTGCFWIG